MDIYIKLRFLVFWSLNKGIISEEKEKQLYKLIEMFEKFAVILLFLTPRKKCAVVSFLLSASEITAIDNK
jgi:hypothetical protein